LKDPVEELSAAKPADKSAEEPAKELSAIKPTDESSKEPATELTEESANAKLERSLDEPHSEAVKSAVKIIARRLAEKHLLKERLTSAVKRLRSRHTEDLAKFVVGIIPAKEAQCICNCFPGEPEEQ